MARKKNSSGIVIGTVIVLLMSFTGAKNAGLFERQPPKPELIKHEETGKEEVTSSVKDALGVKAEPAGGGKLSPVKAPKRSGLLIEPVAETDYKPIPNDSSTSTQWYDEKTKAGSTKK